MQITRFQFESLSPKPVGNGSFAPINFADKNAAANNGPAQESVSEANNTEESKVEAPPPPPPTFSEEQMEAAKTAAFEEGKQAGIKQAQDEIDTDNRQLQEETLQIAQIIRKQIPQFDVKQKELLESQKQEIGKLVLHCSGRISLEALRQNPIVDIEVMIQECLENIIAKSQLVVTAHPKLLTSLNEIFGKEIKLKGDTELSPGDCLVSWETGQAERRIDDIWHEIETIIDRYFSSKVSEANTEDEFAAFDATSEPTLSGVDIHSEEPLDIMDTAMDEAPELISNAQND